RELWAGTLPARHWWDAVYHKSHGSNALINDSRPGAAARRAWWSGDQEQVGMVLYGYESAWLPQSLLRPDQRQRLADALLRASRHNTVELHFNKGLAGASAEHRAAAADTAMNPQVLSAFALAIIADGGPPAYPGQLGAKPNVGTGGERRREVHSA